MFYRWLLPAFIALVVSATLVYGDFRQPTSGGTVTTFKSTNNAGVHTPHMNIDSVINASLAGFPTVQTTGTPIAVTTGGVTGTLPAGTVVVASNVGTTNTAYCKLGASATTSDVPIVAGGGWFAFTVGANTQLTCITSTSTTTVNMTGGSGLPTGTGGGSGGGGGGSVTQGTSPWIVAGGGTAGSAATGVVTVQGIAAMTPLLATATQSGTWNIGTVTAVSSATLAAETTKVIGTVRNLGNAGAAFDAATGAAVPANGLYVGMNQGGNLTGMTGTSGNLNVQCANCSGSGVSTVDAATFTASTSLFAGGGGFFQTTATNNALTNGQQGMWQMTANRAGFVNLRDTAGVAIGTSAAEVFVGGRGTAGSAAGGVLTVQGSASGTAIPVSVATIPSHAVTNAGTFATQVNGFTSWAGGTLGAMANYGTSPGAVAVPGVNAFVTNTNANGQATMANSSPVVLASNQASIPVAATLGTETTKKIGVVGQSSAYPDTAVPYTATATGTTGATTATLAGAASVTTYICGFSIRANATAAATGNATVTGVITATMNFTQWTAPNASGLGITEMIFQPCVPASGQNQSVAVVSAAPGTGGVVSVTAWGYKL